ncbi:alpha/beta fold hydrolase [Rhodococcus sp. HNM0569]|uniref:alpha/beta fold hydrolase n=1 Tax=Rhodococcus sp. HNM0569 TaxID=2716340 RepID=UPI00146A43C2|nr:alpha/beta fold hydrolase [Rhodococcus sp. HNM0569]NLU81320.1 alpha/beta hydrolase [Rhodococcus sp. HNM0569]
MRRLGLIAAVLATCCACSAGPSTRPHVAVEQEPGAGPAPSAPTSTEPAGPPPLSAPKSDLRWTDCTAGTATAAGRQAPAGVVFECATLPAEIDRERQVPGTFTVGVVRARAQDTPPDAAPLVYTSGADRPSGPALASLVSGGGTELLGAHPLVAIDRRGIGASSSIDCLSPIDRRALVDREQFARGGDPVDDMTAASRDATIACTDYLQPQELAFDAAHAADDLEALRRAWDSDTLGVVGSGAGSTVALAYAAKHPDRLARLVLDGPAPTAADAATATEQRVQGQEGALDAFAGQCTALGCPLGPDPRATVREVVDRARTGALGPLSAGAVVRAVSFALTEPDPKRRVDTLAGPIASAAAGDPVPLTRLVTAAESATSSDGQWVARCSDGQQWPSPDRVRDLERGWNDLYPVFGADAALGLLACNAWPSAAPPPVPAELPMPVLVLAGVADPLVGNGGTSSVTGLLSAAGAQVSTSTWHGSGHPSLFSSCVQRSTVTYVAEGTLPADGGACPA